MNHSGWWRHMSSAASHSNRSMLTRVGPPVFLQPAQIFAMIYLTDTNRTNGCLRVLPGSHRQRLPIHDALAVLQAEGRGPVHGTWERRDAGWEGEGASHPLFSSEGGAAVDVPVAVGQLVLGDSRLLHATHPNRSQVLLILCLPAPSFFELQLSPRRPWPAALIHLSELGAIHRPHCRHSGRCSRCGSCMEARRPSRRDWRPTTQRAGGDLPRSPLPPAAPSVPRVHQCSPFRLPSMCGRSPRHCRCRWPPAGLLPRTVQQIRPSGRS